MFPTHGSDILDVVFLIPSREMPRKYMLDYDRRFMSFPNHYSQPTYSVKVKVKVKHFLSRSGEPFRAPGSSGYQTFCTTIKYNKK
jgi:hypothetical protein